MTFTHCRRRTTSQFLKVASLVVLLLEMTQSTGPNQRPRLEICCVMLTSTVGMMADRHILIMASAVVIALPSINGS
jgi:hypothetical protein